MGENAEKSSLTQFSFEFFRVPETRKTIETAYFSRCMEENTKILEELIVLRQKKADLLGYENHAHYVLELRMAKSPKTVKDFLEGLATKLQPLWAKEKEEILKLKEDEVNMLTNHYICYLDIFLKLTVLT